MIKTSKFNYGKEDSEFEGSISFNEDDASPRPGILVVHAYGGHSDFEKNKSEKLAELGYFSFAVDLYGVGKRGANPEESMLLMNELNSNRSLLLERISNSLKVLKEFNEVDPDKTGAIGFCFGGKCVLDLARSGSGINGVVSFHGLYDKPNIDHTSALKSSVLVLHGYNDPMATPKNMVDLADELTERKADWQIHAYSNVGHAFTNPDATDRNSGLFYDPVADEHSWNEMKYFFEKVFQ